MHDTGIRCPHCGTRLRILQGRASWGVFFLFLSALFLAGEVADHLANAGALPKNGAFLGAFVVLVILSLPVTRAAPRLVTLRVAYDGESLEYPLDTEGLASGWVCTGCRERNPSNFEICWKCQEPRAAAASNNRWRGP